MLRVVTFRLKDLEKNDIQARVERMAKTNACTLSEVGRLADIKYTPGELTLIISRISNAKELDDWVGWLPLWSAVMDQNRARLILIHAVPIEILNDLAPRQAFRETHPDTIAEKALGFHVERQIEAYFADQSWITQPQGTPSSLFVENEAYSKLASRVQNRTLPPGQNWLDILNQTQTKVESLKEDMNQMRRNLDSTPEADRVAALLKLTENLDAAEREAVLTDVLTRFPELKNEIQ